MTESSAGDPIAAVERWVSELHLRSMRGESPEQSVGEVYKLASRLKWAAQIVNNIAISADIEASGWKWKPCAPGDRQKYCTCLDGKCPGLAPAEVYASVSGSGEKPYTTAGEKP